MGQPCLQYLLHIAAFIVTLILKHTEDVIHHLCETPAGICSPGMKAWLGVDYNQLSMLNLTTLEIDKADRPFCKGLKWPDIPP